MKYVDDFRSAEIVRSLAGDIAASLTRPWTIMEVCGGQTHAIMRYGLDQLLPDGLRLIHGPGCPVCVTPQENLDAIIGMAQLPNVTVCVYADMLRVPGSETDLMSVKARGADVRIVAGPLDAVALSATEPQREVVFFAVGFETTAPAGALAVLQAQATGLGNFSVLISHVSVPPALEALLQAPECEIQGFLAAGHVCSVTGYEDYPDICNRFGVPIVVAGFEPVDVMRGIAMLVQQLEHGRAEVDNAYGRVVQPAGNPHARRVVAQVFEVVDQSWRGLGVIPQSGLALRAEFAAFDARKRHGARLAPVRRLTLVDECIAGQVLAGTRRPDQCPAFGTRCTPSAPLGAPMVSNEGACAAYHRYRRARTA